MGKDSAIEWTDHTFNPWTGCRAVSPACDHCYAEGWAKRAGRDFAERRLTSTANWKQPLKWNREAAEAGVRARVFCASLADVFDAEVPDAWRDRLFDLIRVTKDLDWLLLTKRPKVARDYLTAAPERRVDWLGDCPWPLPNVWLGTTVENQAMAELRIPLLMEAPAAVRFLSVEPLLGDVVLTHISYGRNGNDGTIRTWSDALTGAAWASEVIDGVDQRAAIGGQEWPKGLDWVIAGGESGPGARPSHPDWFRGLRDQCQAAGVPFLFKQWGEWLPWSHFGASGVEDDEEGTRYSTMEWSGAEWIDVGRPIWCDWVDGVVDEEECSGRVGKKRAGRLLDGVQHDACPISPAELPF